MNLVEFSGIFLNFLEFAVFEKCLTNPWMDQSINRRTKPLIELLFATENMMIEDDGVVLAFAGASAIVVTFGIPLVASVDGSC